MPRDEVSRLTASPRPTSRRSSAGTWIWMGSAGLGSFIAGGLLLVVATERVLTAVALPAGRTHVAFLVRRAVLAGAGATGRVVGLSASFAARQSDGRTRPCGGVGHPTSDVGR